MRKNNDRISVGAIIAIIASAILVAAGIIVAFKLLCDKYSITERKPRKKFIDFDDADEWEIDEADFSELSTEECPYIDETPAEI
ncbi:MAG: hypothetical protein E7635_04525 [Ruminococcaceae bacterium]|nr:hypothetical protein [Oscillospiraceae bacterium]